MKQIIQNKTTTNNAVSPVIGVMLMLVVTIIIAAFVSVFAGTAFGNVDTAPAAAINVKIISNGGSDPTDPQYIMLIEHLGGSSIPTSDLRIISYYTPPSTLGKTMQRGDVTASTTAVSMRVNGEQISAKVPYLNDAGRGKPGTSETNFGTFSFTTGDVLSSGSSAGTTKLLGFDVTTQAKRETFGFGRGSAVDVEIIHLPSQKTVYSGQVVVQ